MKRFLVGLVLLSTACGTTSRQTVPTAAPPALPHPAFDSRSAPAAQNAPPSNLYVFEGVDVFGARGLSREQVLGLLTFPAPGTRVDPSQKDFIDRLIESKKRLLEAHALPFCRFSVGQWMPTHTMHVTVDLVEPGDEWRMPFSPEPQGDVPDPEGLLEAWKAYQTRFWELRRQGAVPEYGNGGGTCRALLCHGGFAHPELAPLEQRFIDGVPRQADALVRVLREDADSGERYRALMLLPYVSSREWIIQAALPSVRDADQGVRNEALRLLGEMQAGQPRVLIPLDPVLEALWYPLSSDRNKAGWALVRLVETEGAVHRQRILERSGEVLLQMLQMKDRIDHEPAHNVLALLAGEDLGEDVEAWRAWVNAGRK
ncbi:HEAT repeat domain-containing protein [Melittangium boletus]|uniref:HEAT repeat domain-containing protein n=1 Tax=Melittangium boletus DSM 14713 TaxID=1294270 RepID=A0A250ICB3_9BACT|nr:HEAT repeat domain-containing protein [Melittangium boletus]ATB29395.1 hypothetical protein MEBOL_002844 [Melittangium boletus DSM 14713]